MVEGSPAARRLKVTVRGDICVGSGTCLQVAPASFVLDDESVAEPTVTYPPESMRPELEQAEALCPSGAIEIRDEPID